jgi:polyhydroxyalkanoate synthesis repressor PhaR
MAPKKTEEPRHLEIRKYANRRYYDSTRSKHLSLDQIHKLILAGYNIRVVDAQTNTDITSKVLTQILLEYEPLKLDMFSNELLTQAIRVNDSLLKDFVDVYFRQAFEAFCGSQKQVDHMLRQAHQLTTAIPTPTSWASNLFPSWLPRPVPPAAPPAQPTAEQNHNPKPAVHDELAAIRKEMATLKEQLRRKASPRTKRGKR